MSTARPGLVGLNVSYIQIIASNFYDKHLDSFAGNCSALCVVSIRPTIRIWAYWLYFNIVSILWFLCML